MRKTPQRIPSPAEFRTLCAGDVMTSDPLTVSPETPLSEVMEAMEQRGIQHFPVVEGSRLVGTISERFVRDAMPSILTVEDPKARKGFLKVTQVKQVAVKNPPTCSPDAPLTGAITVMRTFRVGALTVVEGSKVVGIITSGDLITLLERALKSAEDW